MIKKGKAKNTTISSLEMEKKEACDGAQAKRQQGQGRKRRKTDTRYTTVKYRTKTGEGKRSARRQEKTARRKHRGSKAGEERLRS